MYNAISLTNKNETKCGLQNKNYAKMSLHFRWPKRDETKYYNVISSRFVAFPVSHSWSHFRGWHQGCQVFATKPAQLLLKTSPIAFRGGFPSKVRIHFLKLHSRHYLEKTTTNKVKSDRERDRWPASSDFSLQAIQVTDILFALFSMFL